MATKTVTSTTSDNMASRTINFKSQKTECNFCKNRGKPFDHPLRKDGVIICSEAIAFNNECSYCRNRELEHNHPLKNDKNEITCPVLLTDKNVDNDKPLMYVRPEKKPATAHEKKPATAQKIATPKKSLLTPECNYCKNRGYDFKHALRENGVTVCPNILSNDKCYKTEETTKVEEPSYPTPEASTWAGKTAANVTVEEAIAIVEAHKKHLLEEREAKKRYAVKQQEEFLARQQKWESEYPGKAFQHHGRFWPFKVFGTKFEHAIAERARTDELLQEFKSYLYDKYYMNWMYSVIDTDDDCAYLCDMRDEYEYQQEIMEEQNIVEAEKFAIAEKERLDELRKTMTEEEFEILQNEEIEDWLWQGAQDEMMAQNHRRQWEEARAKHEKANEWHTQEKRKGKGKKEKKANA